MSRGCDRRQPKRAVAAYTGYRWPGLAGLAAAAVSYAEEILRSLSVSPVYPKQCVRAACATRDGASCSVRAHQQVLTNLVTAVIVRRLKVEAVGGLKAPEPQVLRAERRYNGL
mgnify:CR=1 FL=1